MKVYYAHAICIYGTEHEKNERNEIKKMFPKAEIIDPSSHENRKEKQKIGMKFCLKLVENCDIVVFTRLLGKLTAGVGKEINHAISKNISVFELKNNKFNLVKKPLKYLSREQTIQLYTKWRNKYSFGIM